jgi:hypothetical protein
MFERRQPMPFRRFIKRLVAHFAVALVCGAAALWIGIYGYERYEGLSVTDAFLNAAMLLGGMGPVDLPKTHAGKLFAGWYALFAGLFFLVLASVVVAPIAHRIFHKLHLQSDEDPGAGA